MPATLNPQVEIEYPVRDGKPMAETDLHAVEIVALFTTLDLFFSQNRDVYVAMNNFVYFEKGNPKACFSPDVYVVFGVQKKLRDCFMTWLEDEHLPSIVFEFTSASTRREDVGKKKLTCERLGIPEYFLFDPKRDYLRPALQGFRLVNGAYAPIERDAEGRLFSETLQLTFFINELHALRTLDPVTGKILTRSAAEYKEIAERADAEIVRLRAELKRLKQD